MPYGPNPSPASRDTHSTTDEKPTRLEAIIKLANAVYDYQLHLRVRTEKAIFGFFFAEDDEP